MNYKKKISCIISFGELLDKISILEIKKKKINKREKKKISCIISFGELLDKISILEIKKKKI